MALHSTARSVLRWSARTVALLVALILLYFLAALALGLVPANAGWRGVTRIGRCHSLGRG